MKLELKHLAPYLPYGTLIKCDHNDSYGMAVTKNEYLSALNINRIVFRGNDKLILRPLSDLTKEIEHDGEKFVPFKRLHMNTYDIDEDGFSIYKVNGDYEELDMTDLQGYLKLFEWHFDVFNLIESGLALDMNKIKETA